MDHTNYWYGHANIFARWCGLDPDDVPPVRGMIQHGWTFVHGFGYGHYTDWSMRKFVWSDVARKRGVAIEWRNLWVTGAPYLYLLQMEPEPEQEREGTIWYPFHGTKEYERLQGTHDRLMHEIREVEEGPVTVCLYYVEYDDPVIRAQYEDAGFRVVCHGRRGNQWKGDDPLFLYRQLAEQRRHKRVASNRLSTAIFYGTAAGCEPAVYGDPMDLHSIQAGFNGTDLLPATFPEFFGPHTDLDAVRTITHRELGADYLASPEELRYILGWQEPWLESSR